jgi:hypothetical protein
LAIIKHAKLGGPDADDFMRKGFLPDNLPPFVSSGSVADQYLFETEFKIDAKAVGRPSHLNGSKRGFQRRIFSMPHPTFVWDAALFFQNNWSDLEAHLTKLKGSASIPQFSPDTVRSMRFTPHARLPLLRLRALSRYRYCVVTDVSRCYPSIYTHSLPWAIHGRDASKKIENRSLRRSSGTGWISSFAKVKMARLLGFQLVRTLHGSLRNWF